MPIPRPNPSKPPTSVISFNADIFQTKLLRFLRADQLQPELALQNDTSLATSPPLQSTLAIDCASKSPFTLPWPNFLRLDLDLD
eukprot:3328519-Rhodomonas_salina.2